MNASLGQRPCRFLNDPEGTLFEIDLILKTLFPICRSLTGDGVRETFSELQSITHFDVRGIKSGTKVFDWKVPNEWKIEDAYIALSDGKKIIDFTNNNLHVVNFSASIDKTLSYEKL